MNVEYLKSINTYYLNSRLNIAVQMPDFFILFEGNLNSDMNMIDSSSGTSKATRENQPYTNDYKTLVMNHPLFLMAVYDRYKLMAHPLSKSLVYQKFLGLSLILFIVAFLLYATFLAIFTTIVLRTRHPQEYYSLTGFNFDSDLCKNVSLALNSSGLKETSDRILQITMYVILGLLLAKNIWAIVSYMRIAWSKTFTFFLEIVAVVLNFYFIFDYDYQNNVTMRCPIQWQIGAFGLFIGYIALFYYIQYIPIIAIMITGEIDYSGIMYSDSKTAYYQLGYVMLVLFAIAMTTLASNLLIGLAVGEIEPLMTEAKNHRLDMLYELAADFEILKFQFLSCFNRCCTCCFIAPLHYKQNDFTKQWKWWKKFKKQLLESCAREADEDEVEDESEDKEMDKNEQLLHEVRHGLHQLTQTKNRSVSAQPKPGKQFTHKGTKPVGNRK
ncbi:unnamed protein product [Rotaria sp. Silwood1]|nr:unnamed protein product [Rotaria sp. Silwood1]